MERHIQSPLTRDVSQYGGFLRKATVEDAINIAPRLRAEDRAEIIAATGLPPEIVLPLGMTPDRETYVAGVIERPDSPEIIFGVDPVPGEPEIGVIWMVSTPVIFDYPQRFAAVSGEMISRLHEMYPLLTNFIDERNTRHIRWLKWLGFKMLRRIEQFGPESRPFIEFASYRPCA